MEQNSGMSRREREYLERSPKRNGYRNRAKRKKQLKIAIVFRLVWSSLLCVLCYPLGSLFLWTAKARIGLKLLLAVTTAICFFALAAFALTVETDSVFYTRAQDRCVAALSVLQQNVEMDIAYGRQIGRQLPRLAVGSLIVARDWAVQAIPRVQGNFAAVFGRDGQTVRLAKEFALQTLYITGVVPTPVPAPSPAPTPVPAPTSAPSPVPAPTERPVDKALIDAGETVWRVPGERLVHAKADCAAGAQPLSTMLSLLRGYVRCSICFAAATAVPAAGPAS